MSTAQPKLVFILGSPRSGTSWIGKAFDSHPEVIYRMEPDTIDRGDYPFVSDEIYAEEAYAHIQRLKQSRNLKVTGSRPTFQKAQQNIIQHMLRTSLLYGLKGAERIHHRFGGLSLPDLCDTEDKVFAIKSVSSLGRVRSWQQAEPDARVVQIIRHPCGHVFSSLRGQSKGLLERDIPLGFENCEVARKYGIQRDNLQQMTQAERLAWRWVIQNETVMTYGKNVTTVRYEDLCEDPLGGFRNLFSSLGLSWNTQTQDFLEMSISSGDGAYFSVTRNPLTAANQWKENFKDAEEIWSIVSQTRPAQLFTPAE